MSGEIVRCKFCGDATLVKVSEGEFMLKAGEKYLARHGLCVVGSGITVRDNAGLTGKDTAIPFLQRFRREAQ